MFVDHASMRALARILGARFEGVATKQTKRGGQLADIAMYGLVLPDLMDAEAGRSVDAYSEVVPRRLVSLKSKGGPYVSRQPKLGAAY